MKASTDAAKFKRKPFRCDGTFDIECADWDRFVLGSCYDGRRPKSFYTLDGLIDHMRARGGTWWGHAMGIYDGLAILERARERGLSCSIDRSQHRVTRIAIGSLQLRDSYSLFPAPLDEICALLGRPVPHLPWGCKCGRKTCPCGCGGCGGYCQIGERAAQGDPDLEAYCVQDCRDLYDGLHALDGLAGEHRVALRGTLGHTAWIAAQDELGVPDSEMGWEAWRYIRRADRGGRVAIIRPYAAGPGAHHDICNAYPAQLARAELPVGAFRQLAARDAQRALGNLRPGVYELTVRVPEGSFLPPLPWMQGGQMWFPIGELTGTWALPEIGAALERGVEIVAIHSAMVWEATAPIFAPLVKRWYAIRKELGRKTPAGQWIGRMAKALTGKFAERPERTRVVMHPEDVKVCLRKGQCRNGCTKRCGAYEQVDLFGEIWAIPYQKLASSAYPQWSAYLRAMTRIQWLEQAERFGKDLCYGNTDSLWTTGRLNPEPLGDGLGQWEYQHAWTDLEVRSPTTYAFRDETGKMTIRGVPGLEEEDWKRGHGVIDRGVVTFGRAVRSEKGLFQARHRRWSLPSADHKVWFGDRKIGGDGRTWPVDASEIRVECERRKARRESEGERQTPDL